MQDEQGSWWQQARAWLATGVMIAGAVGCAPTSADFRLADVRPGEAAIAGRLTIIYNGQIYTENCFATFGGRKIKMTRDGIVLFAVREGQTALERLDCKDVSNQHIAIKDVHFFAAGHGVVSDFGDVAVTWEAAGGFKASTMFGLIGFLIDEASDDGVANVVVQPPVAEVRQAFAAQTGVAGTWNQPLTPATPLSPVVAAPIEPVALLAPASSPALPSAATPGFFCIGAETPSSLSLCARTADACERIRERLAGHDPAACAPADTAWCYAVPNHAHCFAAQSACELQSQKVDAGPCREQHGT